MNFELPDLAVGLYDWVIAWDRSPAPGVDRLARFAATHSSGAIERRAAERSILCKNRLSVPRCRPDYLVFARRFAR